MIKETVCLKEKKVSLSITNSEISAILRSNTTKSGIRIYENDCLGIAGALGDYDDNDLTNKAKHMLKFKLPYTAAPAANIDNALDLSGELAISDEDFVKTCRELLAELSSKFPQFMLTHKMELLENETSINNTAGVNLSQKDRYLQLVLVMKYRQSKNLMDAYGVYVARSLDYKTTFDALSRTICAYEQKADFTDQKIPVIVSNVWGLGSIFANELNGNVFGTGASLWAGKIGEKLFNDKFSLYVDRNAKKTRQTFFDGEGVVLPDDKFALIENGVLKSPYTTKMIAKQFNLPISGSAGLVYDAASGASPMSLAAGESEKTLKELLGGKQGIYIESASGGDFTPQGEFASPIQTAYFFDGDKLCGRLPQMAMSGNVTDMFGKDFIGVANHGAYPGDSDRYHVIEMDVKKIGDWT
ncbi:MAG: metallopeptidase TldD-related protein [Defluviitaleaceae bacterium]|nr:metallopeptidase TldD-related protein [Defluviitaleaceae bacterium]